MSDYSLMGTRVKKIDYGPPVAPFRLRRAISVSCFQSPRGGRIIRDLVAAFPRLKFKRNPEESG